MNKQFIKRYGGGFLLVLVIIIIIIIAGIDNKEPVNAAEVLS